MKDEPMLTEISIESSNDSLINNDELTDEVQQYLNMFTAELDSNLELECKETGNA
jgi:predicted RNA-binding protein Jag